MSHWNDQAKQWSYITEPLRPSQSDIANLIQWVYYSYKMNNKPLSVLLLGVTPEIIHLPWPKDTTLFTADKNRDMITMVLPRLTPFIKPIPIEADWLNLPLKKASFDLIMGDGCYNLLKLADYSILSYLIKNLLNNNGLFLFRFFLRSSQNESLEKIKQAIINLEIKSFSAFKLRLLMALHHHLHEGILLKNAWDCWNQEFKLLVSEFKNKLHWKDEAIKVIDNYKNQHAFYTFPTITEIKNHLNEFLCEKEIFTPPDSSGIHCPTFVFAKHPL